MLGVFAPGLSFHHNVVDIDFHGPTNQGFEELSHQPLISSANILEPKRHDFVAVQSMWCHKNCIFLIWLKHGDLVVPKEYIYEGDHPMPYSGVYYLIYSGQRKTIIWQTSFRLV